MEHSFAIPVYGEPVFLENCIQSILQQTRQARVFVGTSTPSGTLSRLASRYGLEVYVNPDRRDIATDWNFLIERCDADLLTIAHQDDSYRSDYLEVMTTLAASSPDCLLAFSDYEEITADKVRSDSMNMRIKRRLCRRAFRGQQSISTPHAKRRLLTLGNPVCCPSVILNMNTMPNFRFSTRYRTNLDWDAWLRLADKPGPFIYFPRKLVAKRIHRESETSVTIANQTRQREDREIFGRLWPRPLAAAISAVYSLGYIGNADRLR